MASGGFNLRKWTTNSSELCKLIELGTQVTTNAMDRDASQGITEDDQSYTKSSVGSFATNTEDLVKILGVSWDTQSDMLQFDGVHLSTKFFKTFVFQGVTFRSHQQRRIELHGFSDASQKAYAAAVYIRRVINDHVETALICSKSRVSSLKLQTIPRLELLGALILARLMNTVLNALSKIITINVIYCWTDSTATLYLIRNEKSWKQYVAHRVDEIRKLTPTKVWRHCPGIQNPADLPSRGTTVQQLIESELWWRGPEFLKHD